jgi:hypothetical protein
MAHGRAERRVIQLCQLAGPELANWRDVFAAGVWGLGGLGAHPLSRPLRPPVIN